MQAAIPSAAPVPGAFRLAIGVATRGRAHILAAVINDIARQSRAPDRIIVCGTVPDDVAGLPGWANLERIMAEPGLPKQRNAIMDRLSDCDAVLFIDDDFVMAPGYVAATVAVLQANPDIVATAGTVIADGARGPGYAVRDGLALITADPGAGDTGFDPAPHTYGCNMAVRLQTARAHGVRFDERLPLYAWSEDMDFSHRLGRHGRLVTLRGARGVHLGVKSGRTSGYRLGYSQVANPIYLYQKGSYTFGRAARSVGRNMLKNAARALWSEPFIDRRGRTLGNARAVLDIVRGRLAPERILEL